MGYILVSKLLKLLWRDAKGAFAVPAAIMSLVLIVAIGVAVDFNRLQSAETSAQDDLDGAVLAAARYMSETSLSGESRKVRKKAARQLAKDFLLIYSDEQDASLTLETLVFSQTEIIGTGSAKMTPYFAHLFSVKTLDVKVIASATIGGLEAKDVDVVLIADATGSMQDTLTGIQDNMKKFTRDLTDELSGSGIKLGRVRVQYIFYRDYMIDVHKDWTGPDMVLKAGLEGRGPMYISPFFTMPAQRRQMDDYVDYFIADGGGSFKESGLEAVWLALNTKWGSGDTTVRSIVLWTDAVTRPLGDIEEESLIPDANPAAYWNNDYWRAAMGDAFVALTKEQRQDYIFDNFYPTDIPNTLSRFESKFASFHQENSNGVSGVKTMAINVVSNCWDASPCTDWPELATWDGVDLTIDPVGVSSTDTYDRIVKQVAETVISQVTAKGAIITH